MAYGYSVRKYEARNNPAELWDIMALNVPIGRYLAHFAGSEDPGLRYHSSEAQRGAQWVKNALLVCKQRRGEDTAPYLPQKRRAVELTSPFRGLLRRQVRLSHSGLERRARE